MIYLIGDIHGDITQIMSENLKKSGINIKYNDTIIVLGDFGVMFKDTEQQRESLKYINELSYNVAFIDGNHENFDYLNKQEVCTKWGNRVHKLADRCFHLIRGNTYRIEGHNFLCFGGATSVDKEYRVLGSTYWNEELPDREDIDRLEKSLDSGKNIDYVLTHTCSNVVLNDMKTIKPFGDRCKARDILDGVEEYLSGKPFKWFFGHFHTYEVVDKKHICLYNEDVYSISRNNDVEYINHSFDSDTYRFYDYLAVKRFNDMIGTIGTENISKVKEYYKVGDGID